MSKEKRISTTAMSRQIGLSTKDLFSLMESKGWIERDDGEWTLTDHGKEVGGDYVNHPKYGKYIAWPERVAEEIGLENGSGNETTDKGVLSATALGKTLDMSAQRVNHLFAELGWIEKALKGWRLTEQGKKVGGIQKEHSRSGVPYVNWPESIVDNKSFSALIRELEEGSKGEDDAESPSGSANNTLGFREKFIAKLRATDGHYVRSKAEMLIDNWLYVAGIVHAYERKLPVEEELYCDFYIPSGKVYIEYWGYENDEKYLTRKEKKKEIYAKYNFKLIELEDKDIQNLDDVLPRLLLKHGVESF